jgi:hypothetical protein
LVRARSARSPLATPQGIPGVGRRAARRSGRRAALTPSNNLTTRPQQELTSTSRPVPDRAPRNKLEPARGIGQAEVPERPHSPTRTSCMREVANTVQAAKSWPFFHSPSCLGVASQWTRSRSVASSS